MNKIDEILKIKELLDSGIITQKEFIELKSKIIELDKNEINASEIRPDEIRKCPKCNSIINENLQDCKYCNSDDEKINQQELSQEVNIVAANPAVKYAGYIIIIIIICLLIGSYVYYNNSNKKISENIAIPTATNSITVPNDKISTVIPVSDTSEVSVNKNNDFQTVEGYSFKNFRTLKPKIFEKSKINYLSNPLAKSYKTLITETYNSNEIDFASYYVTVMISTSMGLMVGVMVDIRDGKVYDLPDFNNEIYYESFCENASKEFESKYNDERLIKYNNSNLMVARGCTNKSLTYVFYSFIENKKEFLKIKNFETPILEPCN